MIRNLSYKLVVDHLLNGESKLGPTIAIKIKQTLMQQA